MRRQSIPSNNIDSCAALRLTLSGEGIFGKLRLHQRCESVKAFAHVGGARRQPHLHPRGSAIIAAGSSTHA